MHKLCFPAAEPKHDPSQTRRARLRGITAALGLVALMALTPLGSSQGVCSEPGKNAQCNEFGYISSDSQRDIRGQPIDITVSIVLDTAFADQGSRWLLFSARNVTDDGSNPVTIKLTDFSTRFGDIVTTRVEHPTPNVLNLWVDTLDTPVGTPITLSMRVGATERGAFRLETLVMVFDRGYAPMQDSYGNDASLFTFTLLGVNKETARGSSDSGSFLDGQKLPGFGVVPFVAAVVAVALLVRRRQA